MLKCLYFSGETEHFSLECSTADSHADPMFKSWPGPAILTQVYHGCTQCIQVNNGVIPQTGYNQFLPHPF